MRDGFGRDYAILDKIEKKFNQPKQAPAASKSKKLLIVEVAEDDKDKGEKAAKDGGDKDASEDKKDHEPEPLTKKVVEQIEDGFKELEVDNIIAENDAIEETQ